MEASGAGQTADQGTTADAQTAEPAPTQVSEEVGNGIVVVCGLFEPGAVVELVERGPHEVRPGGNSAVRGRRTVDAVGEVGFSGLIPGDLFFVTGYSDGEPQFVRCVAQDPSSSVTLLQPPEQAIPAQQGTAQVPVVDEPAAEPAEATEGEGLPDGVTSPVLGAGDAQPQRTYLHNGEGEPDAALWRKANVREQIVPADDSRTPNDLWNYIGGPDEPVELGDEWTLYEGPTEPAPVAEEEPATPAEEPAPDTVTTDTAASSTPEAGPAQATETESTVSSTEASGGAAKVEATTPAGVTAEGATPDTPSEPADAPAEQTPPDAAPEAPVSDPNPPAPDAGTPDASESSGTGQANGGAVEQAEAAPAATDPAPAATDGDVAADGTDAVAQAPEQTDPSAPVDSSAPLAAPDATAADAAPESDWDKLVKQAEGLGVPNAASLSDDELRQSISEKSATPVV